MSVAGEFDVIARVKAALEDKSLEFSERVVLARLMLSAGKSGETAWKHETIAARLGVCKRQSKRIMRALQGGHVRVIQMGLKKANRYLMTWHPKFNDLPPVSKDDSGVTPMSPQEAVRGDSDVPSRGDTHVPSGVTPMSLPIVEDISSEKALVEDKSSSSSEVKASVADRPTTTAALPSSQPPTPRVWPDEDLRKAQAALRAHWASKRNTFGGFVKLPDQGITRQITEPFQNPEELQEWLKGEPGKPTQSYAWYKTTGRNWVDAKRAEEAVRIANPEREAVVDSSGMFLTMGALPRLPPLCPDCTAGKQPSGDPCHCPRGERLKTELEEEAWRAKAMAERPRRDEQSDRWGEIYRRAKTAGDTLLVEDMNFKRGFRFVGADIDERERILAEIEAEL